jgi:hypothetical protein
MEKILNYDVMPHGLENEPVQHQRVLLGVTGPDSILYPDAPDVQGLLLGLGTPELLLPRSLSIPPDIPVTRLKT